MMLITIASGLVGKFLLKKQANLYWNFPHTGIELIMETHLMNSTDVKNWSYTNNERAFLPVND